MILSGQMACDSCTVDNVNYQGYRKTIVIYQEIVPRKELQPYVKCFWVLEDPFCVATSPERIVPDGRMEMIFHYGSRFERIHENDSTLQSHSIITGQIRNPIFIRPTGSVGMISARFFPFGFSSIFLTPARDLAGDLYSCEDVLGREGKELEDRIINSTSTEERVRLLEDYFLARLSVRGDYDFRVHRITRKIYELNGMFRSENLAQEFNIGSRQMERLFQQRIGMSPNTFGRVVRFQQAISLKLNDLTLSLTDLTYKTGYYDQSHFIKDFKEFSGLSPRQYFSEVHRMADLFTDNL